MKFPRDSYIIHLLYNTCRERRSGGGEDRRFGSVYDQESDKRQSVQADSVFYSAGADRQYFSTAVQYGGYVYRGAYRFLGRDGGRGEHRFGHLPRAGVCLRPDGGVRGADQPAFRRPRRSGRAQERGGVSRTLPGAGGVAHGDRDAAVRAVAAADADSGEIFRLRLLVSVRLFRRNRPLSAPSGIRGRRS